MKVTNLKKKVVLLQRMNKLNLKKFKALAITKKFLNMFNEIFHF